MSKREVQELATENQWREAYPVFHQLRTHLTETEFLAMVQLMRPEGYRGFGLSVDGRLVAIAGVRIGTNLYDGRHVWVDDLVTDAAHRSEGYGRMLLRFLEDWGRAQGCGALALSSGLQRLDAHRFYEEKMHYARTSYVFKTTLDD